MVETVDVAGLPKGMPSGGPNIADVCAQLAETAAQPGQEGLMDLLAGIHSKLDLPGKSTIQVVVINGRVQKMKVRVVDIAERIYFPDEEVDGSQAQVGTQAQE